MLKAARVFLAELTRLVPPPAPAGHVLRVTDGGQLGVDVFTSSGRVELFDLSADDLDCSPITLAEMVAHWIAKSDCAKPPPKPWRKGPPVEAIANGAGHRRRLADEPLPPPNPPPPDFALRMLDAAERQAVATEKLVEAFARATSGAIPITIEKEGKA